MFQRTIKYFLKEYTELTGAKLSPETIEAISKKFYLVCSIYWRYFLDFLLTFFVFSLIIVAYWRGIWLGAVIFMDTMFPVSLYQDLRRKPELNFGHKSIKKSQGSYSDLGKYSFHQSNYTYGGCLAQWQHTSFRCRKS